MKAVARPLEGTYREGDFLKQRTHRRPADPTEIVRREASQKSLPYFFGGHRGSELLLFTRGVRGRGVLGSSGSRIRINRPKPVRTPTARPTDWAAAAGRPQPLVLFASRCRRGLLRVVRCRCRRAGDASPSLPSWARALSRSWMTYCLSIPHDKSQRGCPGSVR
jgi:hypothetical protein